MPALVDQFGTAISSLTLYKTPSQRRGDFRPIAKPRAKTFEAVSAWQRREMVDVSRVIAAGVPNVDTALTAAGEFSIGDSWHIKYRGTNKAWGKKRDLWFNQVFSRDCNERGTQSDWRSSLRQLNWTRKVEGDYAIVFDGRPFKNSSGQELYPSGKFRVIRFDRISTGLGIVKVGEGLDKCRELGKGDQSGGYYSYGFANLSGIYIINDPASQFDGQRIIDGVIVDGNLRVLGYRITGFNDAGEEVYVDTPKAFLHFNFSARRQADLIRGIPELAEAIIPIMGLDDIQYLVTMAVKLASAMAVTRESLDGNPNLGDRLTADEDSFDLSGAPTTTQRAVQEIFPGIIELSTNNKEALKALDFNRPSMNEEKFIARVETSVLHKLWPRSLIYADNFGRGGSRAIAIQANTICTWDQSCTERSARWIADRATEFAMRAGYIPTNNNLADPYEYVFTVPGKFTVDEGNDAKARLMALGRCVISHGIICEMDGYLKEEIREEREEEIDWILTAAERMEEKHPKFDSKSIALMFDSGESNVSFSESAAATPSAQAESPETNEMTTATVETP